MPALLAFVMGAADYLGFAVFTITAMGIIFSTEIIWTTLMSPLLIMGYPYTALKALSGGQTKCM